MPGRVVQLLPLHRAPYRLRAGVAVAAMAVGAATTAAYAWLVGPLLGGLFADDPWGGAQGPSEVLRLLAGAVLGVGVLRAGAGWLQGITVARLQQDLGRQLRLRMVRQLLAMDVSSRARWSGGDVASRIGAEVQHVEAFVGFLIAPAIRHALTAVALTGLAAAHEPLLALAIVFGLGPVSWLLVRTARARRAEFREMLDASGRLSATADATSRVLPVIYAYQAEPAIENRLAQAVTVVWEKGLRARRLSARAGPLVTLLGAVALAGVLVWGAGRLQVGASEPHSFLTFVAAVLLLFRPVQGLATLLPVWSSGVAALGRIQELLKAESRPTWSASPRVWPPSGRGLEVRGVSFAYGAHEVLREVDLELAPGETVMIAGPNGSGKSTLLWLVMGLLRPSLGSIRLDGVGQTEASPEAWLRRFAWVPQEPMLLPDTILANIALGDLHPSRDRAERAAGLAGAMEHIASLPRGLDTQLGEGGANLSGGERQRLSLARALYREAPILLLDEPTAHLDAKTSRAFHETLSKVASDRSVIWVSHDLAVQQRAHRVIRLNAGRLIPSLPSPRAGVAG